MIAFLLAALACLWAWLAALWAFLAPWLPWVWGPVAVALDGALKSCGVAFLFDRGLRWWSGE